MILPIYAYGQPVLKKVAEPINPEDSGVGELIENMWETMYNAKGVGLAAPQIGKSIRIFVVDTQQTKEEGDKDSGLKKAFINPTILEEFGEDWSYEEGCLSIPHINGDVERPEGLVIRYQDLEGQWHEEEYQDMEARVIQHEYDHLEGILFTEHLKPLKRRLLKRKLQHIKDGKVESAYRMRFV